jgi:pimeloyl-ACP methyl ester carboxylesterase
LYNDLDACRYFDVRKDLNLIEIPAIIICGDQDQMTPLKFSQYLHENIPNSQLVLIAEAGHFVFQEAPIQVNNIIHDSLRTGKDHNDR